MRRLPTTTLATGLLAALALVGAPALVGTSSAATTARPAAPHAAPHKAPAKAAKRRALPAKRHVVLVGVVSATATVTTSGTSTVLVTLRVQAGDREHRGTTATVVVTKDTVVKRDHGRRTRYELRTGDKVVVQARRGADGVLTATYVAASGRPAAVPAVRPATPTATTA